jgi:putative hemolysin
LGSEIFVLVILIVLNAFFAASEIALISLNDNKIKQLADNGDKKAKMLYQLLSEPSRFLATIQIGITLAGFLASAFAAGSFAGRLTEAFLKMGVTIPRNMLETVSVVIITLILSYFTLVLGELVPKRLALQKAEAISMFAVVPLTVLLRVSSPFVKLLTFSTNTIVRLFGVDPNKEKQGVTEEEIRLLVNIGKEKGTIQEAEKVMINNIFEFDNKSVSDIMTHRTNIVGIPINFSLLQTVQLVNVERYTRYPVYEESIDNIIGILHVKDLIQFVEDCDENRFNLKELIREPVLVLETKRIDDLLREMQMNNVHIAIAIDEYGGTDGMVTIEDVIEEIVGNIFDEYDDPEMAVEEIIELKENTYLVAGTTSLYEVENILNLQLPIHEFDTISGFVLDQLGYIPDVIEKPAIEYNNYLFKVDEMHEKRIMSIQISENCVDRQGEI